ncbi:MAG: endonuclease VII [Aquificota bacterium]|nr:MAG: endonuclease VII [Aquificota bacterium]
MTEKQRKTREYNLRRRYGIGIEDYDKMLKKQGGKCAICGIRPKPGKHLDVDHNHKTGRVRGILCRYCNSKLLKHLRDNKVRAAGLVKYLTKALNEDEDWS